jgi:hypothetical protein
VVLTVSHIIHYLVQKSVEAGGAATSEAGLVDLTLQDGEMLRSFVSGSTPVQRRDNGCTVYTNCHHAFCRFHFLNAFGIGCTIGQTWLI